MKPNPAGYVVLSIFAGMYIGLGILLSFTVGGQLGTNPDANLIKGLIFGVALSLVVIPGVELFTGNNFVMSAGLLEKKVKLGQAGLLWLVCWLGNLLGAGAVSAGGMFYNLLWVTLGNMAGGIVFVALPYWLPRTSNN
ncbi:formate/nitrite transporter family protein [Lactobacillus delbrueckii]|nr:formate/nitrite transporter family protein [Lactobacillus delbrueckii]WKZ99237.1 formate/nitrite transporter family protein [Lactobacillus delbrueckii]